MGHALAPRRALPGQVIESTDVRDVVHRLVADADGVVWPRSAEDVRIADLSGLPIIHDADRPEAASANRRKAG